MDETVREIFEIFGEDLEAKGPQLAKNLRLRMCLEKMLELHEGTMRQDLRRQEKSYTERLWRAALSWTERRQMMEALSLAERHAREVAEEEVETCHQLLNAAAEFRRGMRNLEMEGGSGQEIASGLGLAPAVLLGKTRVRPQENQEDAKEKKVQSDLCQEELDEFALPHMMPARQVSPTPVVPSARCVWSQSISESPESEVQSQRSGILRSFESQASTAEPP